MDAYELGTLAGTFVALLFFIALFVIVYKFNKKNSKLFFKNTTLRISLTIIIGIVSIIGIISVTNDVINNYVYYGWTESEKSEFVSTCTSGSEEVSIATCKCIVERLSNEYPVVKDGTNYLIRTQGAPDGIPYAPECG